jgi:chlorobactene glucosyltransferase
MSKLPKMMASVAFLSPPLGWRSERRFRQLEHLPATSDPSLPLLSIIVPARNEASNLQRLLPSLCQLEYPGRLEVIVVDDGSEDTTAHVACSFGVRVISLDDLPRGWLGKTHACHRGAVEAQGEWLLFTDADTIHMPDGPSRAVAYAEAHQLDGLTFHLGHMTNGYLDGITLLSAFAGLFAGLPADHVSMNGQYILLRHDVYRESGGFAAVREEPLEDMALGRYLFGLGYRIPMMRGDDVARVAMYQNHRDLWRGMSRLGAGSLRFNGAGSLATTLLITALMTPLLVLGLVSARRLPPRWFWAAWGSTLVGLWPWSERFGSRWKLLLAPFGALFVQLSAAWGLFSRMTGRGILWKGRMV